MKEKFGSLIDPPKHTHSKDNWFYVKFVNLIGEVGYVYNNVDYCLRGLDIEAERMGDALLD